MSSIGNRIKNRRKLIGMTQEDLAGPNLSHAMISLIERDMANPSIKTLELLAKKLGTSLNYILGEENNEQKLSKTVINSLNILRGLINLAKYNEAERVLLDIKEDDIESKYKGIFFKLKGELFVGISQYNEAILEFEKSLLYLDSNQIDENINVYIQLSTCYRLIDNYHKSIENSLNGLILIKSIYSNKRPISKLKFYYDLSYSYCRIGEFKKGIDVIKTALYIMKETSVTYNKGLFYMLKGLAHLYLREFEQGIISNKKALSIMEEYEQKQYIVGILTNLGILYREVNNYKLSIECIERSINLAIENNLEEYLINNYYELSISYISHNNLDAAEEICKNQMTSKNTLSTYKIKMNLLLAFINLKRRSFEESLKYVNDAEANSINMEDNLLIAKVYTIKSQILSEQGYIKESNEYLKKVIQIYKYKNSYESLDFI